MARRLGEGVFTLSPRTRRIAGWLAAIGLIAGIALAVRIVGGTGDGSPAAVATPSVEASKAREIAFGTTLDPITGLVAIPSRTARFEDGETFAYSVAGMPPQPTLYVAVERLGNETVEVVQPPAAQNLAPAAATIAFSVPVSVLLEAFGPGEYRMRMYLEPDDEVPAAEGRFVLSPGETAAPAPSG